MKNKTGPARGAVPLAELRQNPLFAGVPPKFLLWQKGLVRRLILKRGDVLCRQGEPGHSTYIIRRGELRVTLPGAKPILLTRADLIFGEMACLSGSPRNAEIAVTDEAEVWEVRRDVLDRVMRSAAQQALFEQRYRDRALSGVLRTSELFVDLPEGGYNDCIEFLQARIKFLRVSPGQTIFRQGAVADSLYLVRLGQVRIGISRGGKDAALL